MRFSILIVLLLGLLAAACSPTAAPVSPTPAAMDATAMAVATSVPTDVPAATATIEPTSVPTSEPTSEPTTEPTTEVTTEAVDTFAVRVAQYYLDTTGFDEMATAMREANKTDLAFRTRIARIQKVLRQMPLPDDLKSQGEGFNQTLAALALAFRDNKEAEVIALSSEVAEQAQALSGAIEEWVATNPPNAETVNPFDVALVQYIADSAGFDEMARVLSGTDVMDSAWANPVASIQHLLAETSFPPEVETQASEFDEALGEFVIVLKERNLTDAADASARAHTRQGELSEAIDEWLASNPKNAGEPSLFQISIAQYYLDSAGFHDIAEALADSKTVEPEYLPVVQRVVKLLGQVRWTPELQDEGEAFVGTLNEFAAALREERVDDAIALGDTVHDAQHDLSHAIDEQMSSEDTGH